MTFFKKRVIFTTKRSLYYCYAHPAVVNGVKFIIQPPHRHARDAGAVWDRARGHGVREARVQNDIPNVVVWDCVGCDYCAGTVRGPSGPSLCCIDLLMFNAHVERKSESDRDPWGTLHTHDRPNQPTKVRETRCSLRE